LLIGLLTGFGHRHCEVAGCVGPGPTCLGAAWDPAPTGCDRRCW
jgi:hypothetical protein